MYKKILEIILDESLDALIYFISGDIKISENDLLSNEIISEFMQTYIQKFQIHLLLFESLESLESYELEYEILESNNEYMKLNIKA